MWIYIVLVLLILLVFFINLTMVREHLSETSSASIIEKISNPILNEPIQYIEYNRNNIPVEMRNKLSALLYQKLLLN